MVSPQDDADGVEAMQKLRGKVYLGDRVVDVGKPGGEELHAAGVFGDREIPLLEVAVLPVEHHIPGNLICEEIVHDPRPEGVAGGGTDDMVDEGINESGVDPQSDVSINLAVLGIGIGRGWVLNEVGDP